MTTTTLATPRRRRRFRFGTFMVYVVMIIITLFWITPTVGLLVSSFRPADDVKTSGWWTVVINPDKARFTLDNYRTVLGLPIPGRSSPTGSSRVGMDVALINTLTVALPSTIIPILIAAFAAYGFAWIDFPGRRALFILVVAMLVVPLQISLVPILRDYVALQLGGTYLGVWLAHTGFGLPLAVYLLYNYISTIPRDLFESAFLDGATHFTIFTRLILPLSTPALASFAIFQFLWTWNDLLVALVFLGAEPRVQVVTQRLLGLLGQFGQEWHLLTAGAFISMIVPLIVFFSLQRFFVRGLMAGSVKG
ncbi:MAG: carbohydrate ABC transporter permease [Chloroflexus sp.]|jgi:alpha-glucoside transport system permease protein|uniref:carbohydrate ABC transporter permease n=1 Tax=unclassified Chloroflexus TaxID=2633855 RepID=UPI0004DEE610|nr:MULTISPECIES: carbohydrate ABC transporter permease [unclassified Chloroflexus]MBO9315398.1 carbohydrate ABC transporter permease [Chloroflexus sp.]MBO9348233.1 carbohydrate ABC transporter permease [Chloroflexus sp.]MDN5271622.1 carbohydrate ABC transporter permease [Chloroflexus sp. MS-CIW-1]